MSCAKVPYPSKGAALQVMRQIQRKPSPGRRLEARAYECPICVLPGGRHAWHLTKRGGR